MTAQVDDARHPVVGAVAELRAELSALASTPVWSLTTADTEAALLTVDGLATQVTQLQLRLLHHAKRIGVGASVGATSAASWFAHESRTTRPAAHGRRDSRSGWTRPILMSTPPWPTPRSTSTRRG